MLLVVGLGSNSYAMLFEENFDSMPAGTDLADLGWTQVFSQSDVDGVVDARTIDVQNSSTIGNNFLAMYKKALPGGSRTLGTDEHFLLTAIMDIDDISNAGRFAGIIAYNADVAPGNENSGIYAEVSSNDGSGASNQQIQLGSGLSILFDRKDVPLLQTDLPMKLEVEIHPSETFLHYTPNGGLPVTVAPDIQAGMNKIDEVRIQWQINGYIDSIDLQVIPEPASLALLSLGGLLMLRRRRA